jgi:TPR repeat protein
MVTTGTPCLTSLLTSLSLSLGISLGLMYRENSLSVTKQNIPLAVHLMSLAASMGHVRAMTNLAHALLDVESWLGHYAREQHERHAHSPISPPSKNINMPREIEVSLSGEVIGESSGVDQVQDQQASPKPEEEGEDLLLRWGYNSSVGIHIILTATSEIIRLPEPLRPDCSVAFPLLKYMAEHTFRPNDLTKSGLAAYTSGDLWEALEFYEEAADLGVAIAQENTAFLYQLVSERFCPHPSTSSSSSVFWKSIQDSKIYGTFLEHYSHWRQSFGSGTSTGDSKLSEDESNGLKYRGYDKILQSSSCSDYFEDMALIRWIQVANSGDVDAIRELAQRYQGIDPHIITTRNQEHNQRLTINETKAALLYAIAAAEHGDISSIMALGWFAQKGKAGTRSPPQPCTSSR